MTERLTESLAPGPSQGPHHGQAQSLNQKLLAGLQPGHRVFVQGLGAESALLREALLADPERAAGVTFTGALFPGIDSIDYLALHPQARLQSYFMSPALRAGQRAGRADLLNLDYLGITRYLRDHPPMDAVFAQLTPPDAQGWCSPGLFNDFLPLVWRQARRRVAHLNPMLPRTNGSWRVHVSELDVAVQAQAPLHQFKEADAGAVEASIGARVAELVRDGDTLQFGIGAVPVALGRALTSHRQLRIHSGMVSSSLRNLWEAQAMDADARITTGVVLGDTALHDFVARLAPLWITDASHTHSIAEIAAIPRFMAINSAVEVDLFGQVNSERAAGVIQAGAGGLPAFAQGAQASPGGRLLICLPSTARGGSVSRIVPALDAQALCTVPRHLMDVVVTEHGVAELRGASLDGRAQALIGIAAPEHRDALANAWEAIRQRA